MPMRFRHWNSRRKWMGNVLPGLIWAPLTVSGVAVIYATKSVWGLGLTLLLLGQVLAWMTLNFLGLFENYKMRRALYREFILLKTGYRGFRMFVGVASQTYTSWIDPHEDVGFCCLGPDTLEFYGDASTFVLNRKQVRKIFAAPNVHSLVGLGRWICVEYVEDSKPKLIRIEPRDKDVLFVNFLLASKLKQRLVNWKIAKGPAGG